uniref:Uncharacterized protein n=1 Tax=Strongyloides venezuelensis TaxID=75913 RepID=A0A0K0FVS1_STRVS
MYAEKKMCKKKLEKLRCLKECHKRKKTLLHLALKCYKPLPTLHEAKDLEEDETVPVNKNETNKNETKKNLSSNKITPTINNNVKIMENDNEEYLKKEPTMKSFFLKININSYKIRSIVGSIFLLSSCRGSSSIRIYH